MLKFQQKSMVIVSQSYCATNWQQEVCHFQNALKSPSYIYPIHFKPDQNNVKTHNKILDILNTVSMTMRQT